MKWLPYYELSSNWIFTITGDFLFAATELEQYHYMAMRCDLRGVGIQLEFRERESNEKLISWTR